MSAHDPIQLLFGGMEKLGPGGNAHTSHVLRLLPKQPFRLVVDAGCGAGRQTLVLAKALGTLIHAVDSHEPFLDDLMRLARLAQVDHLVRPHCMDMKHIPTVFQAIDLLWSEGAAYNIGFPNALATWAPALVPRGLAVVSELCWLSDHAPERVREFFRTGYPDMRSVERNMTTATRAGFKVLTTYTLPDEAWVEGYYDLLEPRAKALVDHSDASVREMAVETLQEMEMLACANGSYGYVFYVLQRV